MHAFPGNRTHDLRSELKKILLWWHISDPKTNPVRFWKRWSFRIPHSVFNQVRWISVVGRENWIALVVLLGTALSWMTNCDGKYCESARGVSTAQLYFLSAPRPEFRVLVTSVSYVSETLHHTEPGPSFWAMGLVSERRLCVKSEQALPQEFGRLSKSVLLKSSQAIRSSLDSGMFSRDL